MATLKMRYGGSIISLPEGANFSPGNYGTGRLKYRVNSTSVGELGLTTNTNAKEYCGLQIRVGGRICFIGRVSTTSYIRGDSVDYHGSSSGSLSSKSASASEYKTSIATLPIDYHSSSMSTSTSQYTQVTSTEQVQTNYYTVEVLSKTKVVSYNNGNGNGTSAAAPSLRTLTNATGSTVTSRTVAGDVLTNSSYKETYMDVVLFSEKASTTYGYWFGGKPSVGANFYFSTGISSVNATWNQKHEIWNSHTTAKTSTQSFVAAVVSHSATVYTSFRSNGNKVPNTGNYLTTNTNATSTETYRRYMRTYTQQSSVYSTKTTAGTTITTRSHVSTRTSKNGQSANSTTYGSYSSRWTYYWTSCKYSTASYYSTRTVREYSTKSYTGTTYYSSITRSTTSVSETIHNMNI